MDAIRRVIPSIPILRDIFPQDGEERRILSWNPSPKATSDYPSEIMNAGHRVFVGNLNTVWDIIRRGTPYEDEFWEQRVDLPAGLGTICIREPLGHMSCGCHVWSEVITCGSLDSGAGQHKVVNEDILSRTEGKHHDEALGDVRQLTLDMVTSPECNCAAIRKQIIHLVFADPTSPPTDFTRIVYVRAEVVRVRDPAFFKEKAEDYEDYDRPLEKVLLEDINARLDHFMSVYYEHREQIFRSALNQQT